MVIKMTATEVKTHLLALLDQVENGQEIEITRHGNKIAVIKPVKSSATLWGKFIGVASSNADEEDLYSTGQTWNLK